MKKKALIIIVFCSLYVSLGNASAKILPIFNETYQFEIKWGFLHVGDVYMKTQTKKGSSLIKTYAQITPFSQLKHLYHIEGNFGGLWNYAAKKPFAAFEEVYQGKKYQKRHFRFNNEGKVTMKITEKRFSEYKFPHKGPSRVTRDDKRSVNAQGYQDLLGSFYYIRTLKKKPTKNEVIRIKVLPAGSRKILLLKVLDIFESDDVPFFETKKIMHVKSALAKPGSAKTQKGGDLFFETKSQINMWITYDDDYVPVKMWSKVEYLGVVEILLSDYKQN